MTHSHSPAFSLIEVTIALGITSFCLLALMGLIPAGLDCAQQAVRETAAANLVSGITADLRDALQREPSRRYGLRLPQGGVGTLQTRFLEEDGEVEKALGSAQYRVGIWLLPPLDGAQKQATEVRVLVTWPAQGDCDPAKPATHFTGFLEIGTALGRD